MFKHAFWIFNAHVNEEYALYIPVYIQMSVEKNVKWLPDTWSNPHGSRKCELFVVSGCFVVDTLFVELLVIPVKWLLVVLGTSNVGFSDVLIISGLFVVVGVVWGLWVISDFGVACVDRVSIIGDTRFINFTWPAGGFSVKGEKMKFDRRFILNFCYCFHKNAKNIFLVDFFNNC